MYRRRGLKPDDPVKKFNITVSLNFLKFTGSEILDPDEFTDTGSTLLAHHYDQGWNTVKKIEKVSDSILGEQEGSRMDICEVHLVYPQRNVSQEEIQSRIEKVKLALAEKGLVPLTDWAEDDIPLFNLPDGLSYIGCFDTF